MWQRTPVVRAISNTATLAASSATGGRLAPCASGELRLSRSKPLGQSPDDARLFIVKGDGKPGLGDDGEDLEKLARVVPGEADRVVLVGGNLERTGPRFGHLDQALRAGSLARRRVEGNVHDREPLDRLDLAFETLHRIDGMRLVERHVDDRGDPSRGGGHARVAEPIDARGAPRVHLAVDDPGKHELAARVHQRLRRRGCTDPYCSNRSVTHREVTPGQDAVGKHEVSGNYQVEHGLSPKVMPLPGHIREEGPWRPRTVPARRAGPRRRRRARHGARSPSSSPRWS